MPNPPKPTAPTAEEYWRDFLLYGRNRSESRLRPILGKLPADPRCKLCYSPFRGIGSWVMRVAFGKRQSMLNPKMCNECEEHLREHLGGAEVEVTMLFADIRGSTTLAEQLSIPEFRNLIDRFYQVGARALIETDAYIDKLIGDEISGGYAPGIAGPQHAQKAVEAAQMILRGTGHADPGGPWIPVGVGVHTGIAYLGTVGAQDGTVDFTVLGDAPNVAARLASNAAAGEVLISDEAWKAAGSGLPAAEQQTLHVKGRSQPVQVRVLRVSPEIV